MKPDIITCWPKDSFYPLFMAEMNRDRDLFGKVIIVMTSGTSPIDFRNDIDIKDAIIIDPEVRLGDWRNIATRTAVKRSDSPKILFIEQDFFYHRDFMEKLLQTDFDMVGFKETTRFHPACLLVKREVLDKTDLDFSAYPPEDDHFGKLTKQMNGKTFEELGLTGWYHLSGMTYNFMIPEAFHRRNEFYTYCELCKKLPQPPEWKEFSTKFDGFKFEYDKNIERYFDEFWKEVM